MALARYSPLPASAAGIRSAVVLAAGFGSRMQVDGRDTPKPLVEVADVPVMHRTIAGLLHAGIDDVVVVTGHRAVEIKASVAVAFGDDDRIRFVANDRYELANGVSVLVGARAVRESPFLVTMSDHLLSRSVFALAASHEPPADGATLLVDPAVDAVFDIDDATKVWAEGGRLVRIGKQLTEYTHIDVGVFVCTHGLTVALEEVLNRAGDVSLSAGVAALASTGRMEVLSIDDGLWQDVDDPAMLSEAHALVSRFPHLFPVP